MFSKCLCENNFFIILKYRDKPGACACDDEAHLLWQRWNGVNGVLLASISDFFGASLEGALITDGSEG